MMKAIFLAAAAALALTAATVPSAEAGSWTNRWIGPQGGVYQGGGNCFNGTCRSAGTFTGPNGGVWRQSGSAHQVAPGEWEGERTIVGPGGRTWQHSWTWHGGDGRL